MRYLKILRGSGPQHFLQIVFDGPKSQNLTAPRMCWLWLGLYSIPLYLRKIWQYSRLVEVLNLVDHHLLYNLRVKVSHGQFKKRENWMSSLSGPIILKMVCINESYLIINLQLISSLDLNWSFPSVVAEHLLVQNVVYYKLLFSLFPRVAVDCHHQKVMRPRKCAQNHNKPTKMIILRNDSKKPILNNRLTVSSPMADKRVHQ